ncbi:MAG: glutamine synthetase family protein [Armatimonadota bacterium]
MRSLTELAKGADVSLVRVTYCDNANLIRAKAIPLSGLAGAAEYGVGFSEAQQALPMMYDTVLPASGLTPAGETWLVPDPTTFTPLPYSPANAIVLGDFETAEGRPWEHCPRSCLKRAVARAAAEGIEIQAAFEPEFYLLRPGAAGGFEPVDQTNFAMTLAFDLSNAVLVDLVGTLNAMGLDLQMLHPESGPGQFEVSIRHAEPIGAADRHVLLREAVRGVAIRHGLAASFAAKPFPEGVGSGCHLHLSAWKNGRNLFYDRTDPLHLTVDGYAWIAGLLNHIDGLCALTVPSVNSYQRLRPHNWAGAYACYGRDNREAAVRVITPRRGPESMNLELKTVDGSANPYVALAGAVAAGLDGLVKRLHPGEPVEGDPGLLSSEDRARRHIGPVPDNLESALDALAQDAVLLDVLGAPLARSYMAVRRGEWEALKDLPLAEQGRQHLLRY